MSEPFWVEIAKQVPALLLFVYTVTVFLKHLTQERTAFEKMIIRKTEEMDKIVEGIKEFQREITRENVAAISKITGVVERNSAQLAINEQVFRQYRKKTRVGNSSALRS